MLRIGRFLLLSTALGCVTPMPKGLGTRAYDLSVQQAVNVALEAAGNLGLRTVNIDHANGVVVVQSGMSMWTWHGQTLTVRILPSTNSNQIRISLSAFNPQPVDWGEGSRLTQKFTMEFDSIVQNGISTASAGNSNPAPSANNVAVGPNGDAPDEPKYKLPPAKGKYALIVGIEKYRDLPDVPFAENDAAAMRRHFIALGFPEQNVISLIGSRATASGIKRYLQDWLPKNASDSASLVLYFSGHGSPGVKDGEPYLIPWDGDPASIEITGLPLKDVYASLSQIRSDKTLVLLDSCFSGAGGRSVLAKGARPLVVVNEISFRPPATISSLAAAEANQIAGNAEESRHGLFTYFILRGLNGEAEDSSGRITAQSLMKYISPNIQIQARRSSREQTPVFSETGKDFIFR